MSATIIGSLIAISALSQSEVQQAIPLQGISEDPTEIVVRGARSKIYNRAGLVIPVSELKVGQEHSIVVLANVPQRPELPVEESNAIFIGRVDRISVDLSENQKALYSTYEIQIDRVLKTPAAWKAAPTFSALRLGGFARTPNGATIRYRFEGAGPEPALGRRYLFFLRFVPRPANAFTLLKLWSLERGTLQAAFEDDKFRVSQRSSAVHGKAEGEIISAIVTLVKNQN